MLTIVPVAFGASEIKKEKAIIWTIPDTVTSTIYNRGLKTASGIKLDQKHPEKHRIIAISRDLLGKYNFGDSVLILGTKIYDGIYYIEDLMKHTWKKKIDILINPKDGLNKFYDVVMYKL